MLVAGQVRRVWDTQFTGYNTVTRMQLHIEMEDSKYYVCSYGNCKEKDFFGSWLMDNTCFSHQQVVFTLFDYIIISVEGLSMGGGQF